MVLYGIMSSVLIRAVLSRREVCEQQNVHVSGCEWVSNWLKWRFQTKRVPGLRLTEGHTNSTFTVISHKNTLW